MENPEPERKILYPHTQIWNHSGLVEHIRKIHVICLCLILAFAAMAAMDPGNSVEGKESAGNTVSYTIREPFRIDSDADFPAYANGGGDGSEPGQACGCIHGPICKSAKGLPEVP